MTYKIIEGNRLVEEETASGISGVQDYTKGVTRVYDEEGDLISTLKGVWYCPEFADWVEGYVCGKHGSNRIFEAGRQAGYESAQKDFQKLLGLDGIVQDVDYLMRRQNERENM